MSDDRSWYPTGRPVAPKSEPLPPPVMTPPHVPVTPTPRAGSRVKRKHPARGARAGALVLSCAATGGLTAWFAHTDSSSSSAASALAALPSPAPTTVRAPSDSSAGPTSATAAPQPTATTNAAGPEAFNGTTIETRYGPVQVQVQISDGAISDVAVIEYPDQDGKSLRINARALPTLRTEVLQAQSAHVDTVSGATYTSDAYTTSLQAAIDQARHAGVTDLT